MDIITIWQTQLVAGGVGFGFKWRKGESRMWSVEDRDDDGVGCGVLQVLAEGGKKVHGFVFGVEVKTRALTGDLLNGVSYFY